MKNSRITPQNITKLKKNEIFVFGSNLNGAHIGGAAKFAMDNFGAVMGNHYGIQGQSFAIPTLDKGMQKVLLEDLQEDINLFIASAHVYPKKRFLVTEIGCGIAGFTIGEIAPLFKDAINVENISLPQSFFDIITKPIIKGYKVTNSKMQCCPDGKVFQYELNKIYKHTGRISPCNTGFHYCQVAADCFNYYTFTSGNRVFEIIDHGAPILHDDKSCTDSIELVRELSWIEVLEIVNTGKGNSGIRNAGNYNAGNDNAGNYNAGNDNAGNRNAGNSNAGNSNAGNDNAGNRNAGNYNAGNDNAGNYNAGNRNAGNSNAGNDNAGIRNAGNYNAGNRNAGNYNAGNYNAGNRNAGNYNAGNRNAGYSNAGNDNAGAFNNLDSAPYMLFNKPSKWAYNDFIKSDAYRYLSGIETTLWIPDYKMTESEKKEFPFYVTVGGYVKHLPYKESFQNSWNNWSEKARLSFKSLPNFDSEIFFEITGIKV